MNSLVAVLHPTTKEFIQVMVSYGRLMHAVLLYCAWQEAVLNRGKDGGSFADWLIVPAASYH
jgi:hypothetical protein